MLRHSLLLLASLALPAFVCSAASARPNIVLVLSDDHSWPFIGCYGTAMQTPNLDRFAAEGIKCSRMFTGAPQCVPSRATIMTGRSPVAARITRFSSPLHREEITFPEVLRKEAGYFVGVLGRTYHLDGSARASAATEDFYDEHHLRTFKDRFDYVDASSQDAVPSRMKEFFDQRPKDKPYFLWVNFNDPHHPWNTGTHNPDPAKLKVPGFLPDLPGVRESLSRYQGEIEHADGDFQTVLSILKDRASLDNTLILFMGDNGMAFPSGKGTLHDPGLNVPLLAWWPGVIKPGRESDTLLSGEDIGPTCLQAAGVAVPERMSGVSFLPLLRGEDFKPRDYIFAERGPHGSATYDEKATASGVDYSRCVRSDRYKLIYNVTPHMRYTPVDCGGDPVWQDIVKAHEQQALATEFETLWFTSPRAVYELYDLQADPSELHNLAGQKEHAAMELQLKTALQKKMILDYDYLPLPIAPDGKKGGAGKAKAKGDANANPNSPSERAKAFLQKDVNHDGKLSFEEFRGDRGQDDAMGWFKARDTDNDGAISEAEFTTGKVEHPPVKK